jgi:hypothetical protein
MDFLLDAVWYLIGMFSTLFFYVYVDKIMAQKIMAYVSLFLLIFVGCIIMNYYVNEMWLFLGIVVFASAHTTTEVLRIKNERKIQER